MQLTWGRVLSALIAAILLFYVVAAQPITWPQRTAAEIAFRCAAYLAGALALIWFPEQIAAAGSYVSRGGIAGESPARVVRAAGWCFLVVPPLLACLWNGMG